MGYIEISDGTTNRRKPVKEIAGTIRIERTKGEQYQIIIPDGYAVKRSSSKSTKERMTRGEVTEIIDSAFEKL